MMPLHGVVVVAVESYGAGPYGTMVLADLGADVIKVEDRSVGGDSTRKSGPFFDAAGRSYFYETFNRNKRSITLDLQQAAGREVLADVVRNADAVMNNLRGDVPAKLGLDYAALGPINPKIVCVHLSAYGREGSRAAWPGYDFLMQAETGYLSLTGEPDGPPARCGVSVVDMMGGLTAAVALVSGVLDARQSGRGRDYETSLFDVALASLWYNSSWYLNAGHTQARLPRSAHASLGPTQLYRTKDGWIFLMCPIQKFWVTLTELIERPDLTDHPDFKGLTERHRNRERLTAVLDEALMKKTTEEWMKRMGGRIPAAPIYDVAEALDNPFLQERGRILEYGDEGDQVRLVAPPVSVAGERFPMRRSPALGADTETLLRSLGYDEDRLRSLRAAGVI
jgi:succinate--hydroxymethylglutarate CoA-transferase